MKNKKIESILPSAQLNQNWAHVVAAQLLSAIFGHQIIEKTFHNLFVAKSRTKNFDVIHHFLRGCSVLLPNPVAAQQHEVVLLLSLYLHHLRQRYHDFLLVGSARKILEPKVSQRSWQRQKAVDPSVFHRSAGFLNSLLFKWQLRLMISGKSHSLMISTEDCSWISGVGDVVLVAGHNHGDESSACSIADLFSFGQRGSPQQFIEGN